MLKYKRVSLKLSGEAMGGGKTIDFAAVAAIAREIKTLVEAGVEVGVTIGAGNIWRGRSGGSMDRNRADQMGMLATTINCMAMEAALKEEGVETLVLSTLHMPSFCDDFSAGKAIDAMRQGKVCLFACGTGRPFFSTDTAAALKAAEIYADALVLAKNVDGVYSADPNKDPNAVRYSHLTYQQVIERNLQATDLTAITLCKEQKIPVVVCALKDEGAILRAINGQDVGTVID